MKNFLFRISLSWFLIVSNSLYIIPSLIMLSFIYYIKNDSIEFGMKEIYGNRYQESTSRLISNILQAVQFAKTDAAKFAEINRQIKINFDLLSNLNNELSVPLKTTPNDLSTTNNLALGVDNLKDKWQQIYKNTEMVTPEQMYGDFNSLLSDLQKLTTYIGNSSNLILDPDLDSYYLMDITLLAVPQIQNRLWEITKELSMMKTKSRLDSVDYNTIHTYIYLLNNIDLERLKLNIATIQTEDPNFYGVSPTLIPGLNAELSEYQQDNMATISALQKILSTGKLSDISTALSFVDKQNATLLNFWWVSSTELTKLLEIRTLSIKGDRNFALIVSISVLLIAMLLNFFVYRIIKARLMHTSLKFEQVALGDLTQPISDPNKDVIGTMIRLFAQSRNKLRSLVTEIFNSSAIVKNTSEVLTQSSLTLTDSSKELSLQSTSVASATEEVSMGIEGISAAVEEMSTNIRSISDTTQQISGSVDSISKRIQRINNSMETIEKSAQNASTISHKAMDSSNIASTTMSELSQITASIGNITVIIKKISEQTHLLALNATIEAASAGDAGKGFAVVANEIKDLANRTAKAVEEINVKISAIQNKTTHTEQSFGQTFIIIKEISTAVTLITNSVEEQTQFSKQIAQIIAETANDLKQISNAITELSQGAGDIAKNISESSIGVRSVTQNILFLSKEIEKITNSVFTIKDHALHLNNISDKLSNAVSVFKIQ